MQYSTQNEIADLVQKQREYFAKGETLDLNFRIAMLKKLKNAIIKHQDEIVQAMHDDLARSEAEAFLCDVGTVILEINETIRGLKKWARPEHHFSGFLCFPSMSTRVYKMPYGVTLIISPFNFPFMLSLGVLLAAIAGGNTAVIKASSKSEHSTKVLQNLISNTFDPSYVAVVDGGHDIADLCLMQKFDKIFYTGSPKIGRHVLEMAAGNLTPVALELGGETGNWAVVRKDADLKDAARKIAFFKLCNSGQICINVNQVAVASEVADKFVGYLKDEFVRQIGPSACDNEEYSCLISQSAYDKCAKDCETYSDRVVFGGTGNRELKKFNPTIIFPVDKDEEIVRRELFCPLLPVVPFNDSEIDGLMKTIAEREHGLALYLFTKDIKWANRTMSSQQFGGGCINEVCIHLMVRGVPFNGTGHSGMGAYHGEWGFREFTHPCTVLKGSTHFNLSLREHPYTGKGAKGKMKLLKMFEK